VPVGGVKGIETDVSVDTIASSMDEAKVALLSYTGEREPDDLDVSKAAGAGAPPEPKAAAAVVCVYQPIS